MSEQGDGDQPSRDWLKMQSVVGSDPRLPSDSVLAPPTRSVRRSWRVLAIACALAVILATAVVAWMLLT